MNIILWILQSALAILYLAGGAYKTFKSDDLAKQEKSIPRGIWPVLGIIEMVGGLMLVVPAFVGSRPDLVAIGAAVLAIETLLLAAKYGSRSMKLVTANPFPWAAAMGVLAAIVAYGRYALSPLQ